jgi:hypothetical protein
MGIITKVAARHRLRKGKSHDEGVGLNGDGCVDAGVNGVKIISVVKTLCAENTRLAKPPSLTLFLGGTLRR